MTYKRWNGHSVIRNLKKRSHETPEKFFPEGLQSLLLSKSRRWSFSSKDKKMSLCFPKDETFCAKKTKDRQQKWEEEEGSSLSLSNRITCRHEYWVILKMCCCFFLYEFFLYLLPAEFSSWVSSKRETTEDVLSTLTSSSIHPSIRLDCSVSKGYYTQLNSISLVANRA